ncbi:LuxR C-terminal-related transcriptional regulator [Chloroflexota bacterium]
MTTAIKPHTLINTKFRIPRVSSDLVPRSHLIKRLNDGLNRKLTIVSAPAGYGKTTLLSQWLADSLHPVSWLSLDENDNDPIAFLRYFVAAVQTIFPAAGQASLSMLEAPQKPSLEHITSTLINELAEQDRPFLLVLDDFHTVSDSEVHQLMDTLITYMPSEMHLVMASRKDFPFPLVRLRIGREMTEIRMKELRFTHAETMAYLEQITALELSSETVAMLEERTEGWIAALRLAVIAMRGEKDHEQFVRSFRGSHRDLMNYLINEVLSQQSENVHAFLLKTSILNRFCAPLAEVVSGGPINKTREIIERLGQANLFVIPLDQEHTWFRYHHMFQEMLFHRLQADLNADNIATIHNNASGWFNKHGFIDDAIRHAIAADNVGSAAVIIDNNRHGFLDQSNWRQMERWLNMVSAEFVENEPSLLVLQAWLLLHTLKLGEMDLVLQRAEKLLENGGERFPEEKVSALRGEIDTMRSYFWNVAGGDPKKGFECAQRALKNLPPTHSFARGMALDFECFVYYFSGQKDRAVRLLSDAAYHPTQFGPSKLQTFIGLCHLYLISGDLHQLLQTAEDFLQMVLENRQSIGIAYAHYFIGYARYEWNELDLANDQFSKVADMSYGASAIVFKNSMYVLSLVLQNQGEIEKAQETMDTLDSYFREIKNSTFLPEIRSVQARLGLLRGELLPAVQWAESVNIHELQDSPFNFEVQGITWSRVLITQGTTASLLAATQYLITILATAEKTNNIRWMISILSHLAVAYKAQGRMSDALDALERSVKLAQLGGFIRTYVDLGEEISVMLRQLANQGVAVDYIKRILSAFHLSESSKRSMKDDPLENIFESSENIMLDPLTRRECEIMLQLYERRTNMEIADKLNISILTVKKHTSNLYQKLGVRTRLEAVRKAKALGLFSE